MEWGIIAFIDVMGFKGMWRRGHQATEVLASLVRSRNVAAQLVERQNRMGGGDLWDELAIEVRPFSDTLVILAPLPPETETLKADGQDDDRRAFYKAIRHYMLLRYVVLLLSEVLAEAAANIPPLLYRGCIAAGEYEANDFAFVGPVVDEAGGLFEAAEGAFVFLAPSAAAVFRNRPGLLARAVFPYFVEYRVPLKGKEVLETFTLNPLLLSSSRGPTALKAQIVSYFETDPSSASVEKKRDNTQKFLDFIEANWLQVRWPGALNHEK